MSKYVTCTPKLQNPYFLLLYKLQLVKERLLNMFNFIMSIVDCIIFVLSKVKSHQNMPASHTVTNKVSI